MNSQWKCLALVGALTLAGCGANVGTDPQNTGGGGISPYEGHSARKQDASGTGMSATARGQGPVPGSGATGEPGNVNSPTESNGGTGETSQERQLEAAGNRTPGTQPSSQTPSAGVPP